MSPAAVRLMLGPSVSQVGAASLGAFLVCTRSPRSLPGLLPSRRLALLPRLRAACPWRPWYNPGTTHEELPTKAAHRYCM